MARSGKTVTVKIPERLLTRLLHGDMKFSRRKVNRTTRTYKQKKKVTKVIVIKVHDPLEWRLTGKVTVQGNGCYFMYEDSQGHSMTISSANCVPPQLSTA